MSSLKLTNFGQDIAAWHKLGQDSSSSSRPSFFAAEAEAAHSASTPPHWKTKKSGENVYPRVPGRRVAGSAAGSPFAPTSSPALLLAAATASSEANSIEPPKPSLTSLSSTSAGHGMVQVMENERPLRGLALKNAKFCGELLVERVQLIPPQQGTANTLAVTSKHRPCHAAIIQNALSKQWFHGKGLDPSPPARHFMSLVSPLFSMMGFTSWTSLGPTGPHPALGPGFCPASQQTS